MSEPPAAGHRQARTASLSLVLLILCGNLALSMLIKAPCASGDWADGRQYIKLCYTDIVPLYSTEHLEGNRLPYLNACPANEAQCDEYPVLGMYVMRGAASIAHDGLSFFLANAIFLILAAFTIAIALYMAAGMRAVAFVVAPTLAIYAFTNWDLITVALATVATLLYLRKRDTWSGVMLGLGAAAKLYPALLVIPFVAGRFRQKEPDGGIHLAWAAAGAWLLVNLPFAIAAPSEWFRFFHFNSVRSPDWDSLWFIGCHKVTGQLFCPPGLTPIANIVSLVAFAALAALVWRWKSKREPGFPRWTLGFPLIALFLVTNKVYSPQYGLWLLPWFALALPDWRLFAAFEAADIAVFVTRFSWFGNYSNTGGWVEHIGFGWFEIAIVVRTLILIACIVTWVRRKTVPLPEGAPKPGKPDRAGAGEPDVPEAPPSLEGANA